MPTIPKTFGEENKRKQNPSDFYETPYALAARGVELAYQSMHGSGIVQYCLDPALGTGVYAQAMMDKFPNAEIYGIDLYDQNPPDDLLYDLADNVTGYDFTKIPTWKHDGGPHRGQVDGWPHSYDLIVTNPPFSLAEEYIKTGYQLLGTGGVMCLLLKAEYYCGQGRIERLFTNGLNPWKIVVPYRSRISFDGSGKTNTIDHAYYIWVKHWAGVQWNTTIEWEGKDRDWKE